MNNTRKPIGLAPAVERINNTCRSADMFYRCGLKPPHYIFNIDKGNGQTTLTEFIANSYNEAHIRHFGGLDLYLEYHLDGSMKQMKKIFAEIGSSAVYTNTYEGVIAIDIGELANFINEEQIDFFLNEIKKTGREATYLFYVSSKTSRNVLSLISRIKTEIENTEYIEISPYSEDEIEGIMKNLLEQSGVCLKDNKGVNKKIHDVICGEEIRNVKAVQSLRDRLLSYVDYSGFIPKMGLEEFENYQMHMSKDMEVKDNEKRQMGK